MKQVTTFQDKYQIILDKDSSYDGVFITAVKTTGIFCRPACPARKPKRENVVFYNTAEEAILNGYRPCKKCKPLEMPDATPLHIQALMDELNANPYVKISDADLRARGISPETVRRWFKKHHNMTFQGYQRMLRINNAYQLINSGETVTHAAFDSGYESLSGFNSSFKGVFGRSAKNGDGTSVIHIVRFATPLGPMFGCATSRGVCLLEFTNRRMLETEFRDLRKKLNAVILPGQNAHLNQLQLEMSEYFDGHRKTFTVALHTPGTDFQNAVWQALRQIPYGETMSYRQIAAKVGNPKAVRAVGTANGMNKVSIVIPCHRVIGTNGSLTGYGGGLDRKAWLLNFESGHALKKHE